MTLAEPREHRILKTIARVIKQQIPVEKVPTIADLRARRLELTRAALSELLLENDFERFRVVVETLTDEFEVMDVALAAVQLAHEAAGGVDAGEEIPEVVPHSAHGPRGRVPQGKPRAVGKGARAGRGRAPSGGTVRLFVGAGRSAGIRPQDLVGAIAGESRLRGHDIGAIEIADRFSLVEVPHTAADEVITALRGTSIKGRKATIRRQNP